MKRMKGLLCVVLMLLLVFALVACADPNPEYKKFWFTRAGCDGPTVGNKYLIDVEAGKYEEFYGRDDDGYWLKKAPASNGGGSAPSDDGGAEALIP